MKKGLRPADDRVHRVFFVRTVDLMKKGLRLQFANAICVKFCQNRRPDEEGIKTDIVLELLLEELSEP